MFILNDCVVEYTCLRDCTQANILHVSGSATDEFRLDNKWDLERDELPASITHIQPLHLIHSSPAHPNLIHPPLVEKADSKQKIGEMCSI